MRLDRPLLLTLAATLAATVLFLAAPDLDLRVAAALHDGTGFVGRSQLGEALRKVFFVLPFLTLAIPLGVWALDRWRKRPPRVCGLAVLWLLGTLAAGPWLLVNEGLKEHSGRPRPGHVREFGGKAEFRPFGRFDGTCATNCSFVSGEAAAAAWTLAPALLVPAPWRAAAVAASLAFTLAAGGLRMAFGGHFLSDVLFAALFVWLIVLASRPPGLRR